MTLEPEEIDDAEVRRFVELIHHRFGYDFQGYALGSLARRIEWLKSKTGLVQPGALERRVEQDPSFLARGARRAHRRRERHVPRPALLPGLPAQGGPLPAHLSPPAPLGGGLRAGRGGLFAGHHPARGGAGGPVADLRHRRQPRRRRAGPRGDLPGRVAARVRRELPGRRAGGPPSPATSRWPTATPPSTPRCARPSASPTTTWRPTGCSARCRSSAAGTCSSTSTAPCSGRRCGCSTPAWRRAGSWASAPRRAWPPSGMSPGLRGDRPGPAALPQAARRLSGRGRRAGADSQTRRVDRNCWASSGLAT